MSSRHALIISLVVAATPGASLAVYQDCTSARNGGWNAAHTFVQGALGNRCDSVERMDLGIAALQRMTKKLVWSIDADPEIVCFYAGYFEGLVQITSLELEKCVDPARFGCVGDLAIAGYAEATFVALFKALARPGDLTPDIIKSMIAPESALADYTIGACDVVDRRICASVVYDRIAADLSFMPPASLVDAVVAAACVR